MADLAWQQHTRHNLTCGKSLFLSKPEILIRIWKQTEIPETKQMHMCRVFLGRFVWKTKEKICPESSLYMLNIVHI